MAERNAINAQHIRQRPAVPDDKIFINGLFREIMKPYIEQTWPDEKDREECYKRNERGHEDVTILEHEDSRIGYFLLKQSPEKLYLDQIHLIPEYQGHGIGSFFIKKFLSDAKNLNVELIVLKTNPAKKLYERLGFQIVGDDEYRHYMIWKKK
jgi:ribosomal protein S18 acetylase RimI-like enzyme